MWQTVCIPKELKQWILIHLHRFQDISYQTLFNDMYGFLGQESLRTSRNAWQGLEIERYFAENFPVENLTDEERQERHERTVKAHITRIEYSPYETTFYEELGRYFCFKMCEYDCAIETFSQAILLKPDYSSGYIRRGVAVYPERGLRSCHQRFRQSNTIGILGILMLTQCLDRFTIAKGIVRVPSNIIRKFLNWIRIIQRLADT